MKIIKLSDENHKTLQLLKAKDGFKSFDKLISILLAKAENFDSLAVAIVDDLGLDFTCEECGTECSIFDDECGECGEYTSWSTDCQVKDTITLFAEIGIDSDMINR